MYKVYTERGGVQKSYTRTDPINKLKCTNRRGYICSSWCQYFIYFPTGLILHNSYPPIVYFVICYCCVKIIECVAGKPIFILTWAGTQPDAQSILLNSHTDVVPVYPDSWKHPPFSAFKVISRLHIFLKDRFLPSLNSLKTDERVGGVTF